MGTGIIVCGLNGSGKSTLGKALSEALGFHFIDNERLFFPKDNPHYEFSSPRSREEVTTLLMEEIRTYENFVFAAVIGNYGKEILPFYRSAVLIDAPKDLRLQRVRNRSFQKFGNRMLPGGDLYEQEEAFFDMVSARPERYAEDWVNTLQCPIIRVNGADPIEENVALLLEQLSRIEHA